MAISKEFLNHLEDLFSVVPGSTLRRMFGGVGVFRHGLMFALATDKGEIAVKTDGAVRALFEAEGAYEWIYESPSGKRGGMGYWIVPETILEDEDAFREWSERAFEVAVRADQAKPPGKRKLKA